MNVPAETRDGVGGNQLMGAAAGSAGLRQGDQTRTSTSAAGRHVPVRPGHSFGSITGGLLAAPRMTLTPGMRTLLGNDWYFLAGLPTPLTTQRLGDIGMIFWFMKAW